MRMRYWRQRGVTLIELMIVVAIIGIIAAVAYPNYLEHIRGGHRASAKARMFDMQARLQTHYSQHGEYTKTLSELDFPATLYSESHGHSIALDWGTSADSSTYKITATPLQADPTCSALTLDHLGVYGPAKC